MRSPSAGPWKADGRWIEWIDRLFVLSELSEESGVFQATTSGFRDDLSAGDIAPGGAPSLVTGTPSRQNQEGDNVA